MSKRRRATFRHPGSNTLMLDELLSYVPRLSVTSEIDSSAEWFAGTAVFTIFKERHRLESINDKDGEICHFLRMLQREETRSALVRSIEFTPYAREELELAFRTDKRADDIERARRFYVRQMLSRSSTSMSFRRQYRPTDKNGRGMTPGARTFADSGYLREYGMRLTGVQIENMDGVAFGLVYDHPSCFHYIDPPFRHDTRENPDLYREEMDDGDHLRLIHNIVTLEGYAILRHYRHDSYDEALLPLEWERVDFEKRVDGSGSKMESLYINPKLSELLGRLKPLQLKLDI